METKHILTTLHCTDTVYGLTYFLHVSSGTSYHKGIGAMLVRPLCLWATSGQEQLELCKEKYQNEHGHKHKALPPPTADATALQDTTAASTVAAADVPGGPAANASSALEPASSTQAASGKAEPKDKEKNGKKEKDKEKQKDKEHKEHKG